MKQCLAGNGFCGGRTLEGPGNVGKEDIRRPLDPPGAIVVLHEREDVPQLLRVQTYASK